MDKHSEWSMHVHMYFNDILVSDAKEVFQFIHSFLCSKSTEYSKLLYMYNICPIFDLVVKGVKLATQQKSQQGRKASCVHILYIG